MGMVFSGQGTDDSQSVRGGDIPGALGVAAFTLQRPKQSAIPVLIAVPHAGRAYPAALVQRLRNPGCVVTRLEDRYADKLAERVCAQTGATMLVAQAPRAMIDLNRHSTDVDWDMFADLGLCSAGDRPPGQRARSGLGLIPRRLPGVGELWKGLHREAELAERLAKIHQPYHDCLSQVLAGLRARWGAALLIDLHSMPSLPKKAGQAPVTFVLGDRFGAASNGGLVASAFSYLSAAGRVAAHNRPYAGGYVLERHAQPSGGIHAIQIEIDRACYLDSRLSEPGPGFADTVADLVGMVRRLAGEVVDLGRRAHPAVRDDGLWAEAAE